MAASSPAATPPSTRRGWLAASPHAVPRVDTVDPTLHLFYSPHTRSALAALLLLIIYRAYHTAALDVVDNTKSGLLTAALVFLVMSALLFRDGIFIRPHPVVWRVVIGMSVLYELLLILLLFQNKQDARRLLTYIDPALNQPLVERTYGDACDLSLHNIRDQMDVFVIAHALGWWAKAVILRDEWLCWCASILFELLEYSLAHQLPNFHECWWDHWILDVLLCNWLGIWAGMRTCDYFEVKTYSWRGIRDIPHMRGKLHRTLAQFSPHSWTVFEWSPMTSWPRFAATIALLTLLLLAELNAFYLKYLLWLEPPHPINLARLFYYFLAGNVAVRELYQYATDPACKRLGSQAFLVSACILTELLVIVKFGQGEFTEPAPRAVVVAWAVALAALTGWAVRRFAWGSAT